MLKVLVVDDDRNMCECLLRLLPWADMGCELPSVANNGMEAWEILQNKKIDFIICDLKMPVMDGIELCKHLYENDYTGKMVFLSAYEDFGIARKAIQYGVIGYILKPINRESMGELEKIIRNVKSNIVRKTLAEQFFDEEYNKKIFEAICSSNVVLLQDVFNSLKKLEIQEVQHAGMNLFSILYDYLCTVNKGMDHSFYNMILRKWRSEFTKITELNDKILYIWNQYQKELQQNNTESETEYICRKIKKLVDENYSKAECNIAWIAEKLDLTSSYAGRIFARITGIGLAEYIAECRMNKACNLLMKTNLSIGSIAEQAGYMDSNYFTKVFRNKIGMAPSEFRRKSNRLQ